MTIGGSGTSGNDSVLFVGNNTTSGSDLGAGDDVAMINVDASVTMGGLNQIFSGGSDGYDTIQLVEGVREDNGAEVDFTFGPNGDNSAFVTNYGGDGSEMVFNIEEFESIQLTDNADVMFIAAGTGAGLTDTYDAAYLNGGGSNSMLKVRSLRLVRLTFYMLMLTDVLIL